MGVEAHRTKGRRMATRTGSAIAEADRENLKQKNGSQSSRFCSNWN